MVADRQDLTGLRFHKMTGSGNDFVFLDGRVARNLERETPEVIRRLCARGTGIGADGVVWLLPGTAPAAFRMRYRNSDGSIAAMCGNASLCSVNLAIRLGMAPGDRDFEFDADAGRLRGRLRPDGLAEVDLTPVHDLRRDARVQLAADELRAGFANTGVPHIVVEVRNADLVNVADRGRALRSAAEFGQGGANVNFISAGRRPNSFRMRTYERGVEAETLACGTGAAACAAVLEAWLAATGPVTIETTSGRDVLVSMHDAGGISTPSLAGEGRLVFSGELRDL